MGNNYFTICSLFYIVLLTIVYFSKSRLEIAENKIYKGLIISNLVTVVMALFSYYTISNYETIPVINEIVSKALLVCFLTWYSFFTIYTFIISFKKDREKEEKEKVKIINKNLYKQVFNAFLIFYFIIIILIIVFPLHYNNIDNIIYSYGPAANVVYIAAGGYIVLMWYCMIANFKNLKSKKYLPLFAFLIFGTIVMIIQNKNPGMLLITSMETFITFLMYFTIENPDMKLIKQLDMEKDRAEKANAAKTDFLSNMSHEIRTPLNAIDGFSQAILDTENIKEIKEEAKDIMMASKNLIELVNGILDISKIEANKLEIINSNYNIKEMIEEVSLLIKSRMEGKSLEFKVEISKDLPDYLYGDEQRIKQILINLLTNAVKYTKEGYVSFKINTISKAEVIRMIVSVEDTGIGIKDEDINKLFQKFSRVDLEKNKTTEGTGLGLAITKSLVELMNGKIIVQSKYGKGSTFTVMLDQLKSNPKEIKIKQTQKEEIVFNGSSKKILVVDDNKTNIKVAEILLKKYKFQIDSVLSGQECLDKINNGIKYDLILMDDMMPRMSGSDCLLKLKEIQDFNIPVIVLTANAIEGMKEKYLSLGFDDYISKPIEKLKLSEVLNKYLNK